MKRLINLKQVTDWGQNLPNIASRLIVLGLLAANAMGAPSRIESFVLPIYPELLNRAGFEGSLRLEITLGETEGVTVDVVDFDFQNHRGEVLRRAEPFIEATRSAFAKWRARSPVVRLAVEVVFELTPYKDPFEGKTEPFYQYEVYVSEGLPTKMVVKARRLLPEIVIN